MENKSVKTNPLVIMLIMLIIMLTAGLTTYAMDTGFVDDTGRKYDGEFHTLANGGTLYDCFRYGEDEAVVYAADAGIPGQVDIPETIYDATSEKYRTVVGIISKAEAVKEEYSTGLYHYEEYYFGGNSAVKELTLPSTIKFVGQGVLYKCDTLKKVTFNSSSDPSAEYTVEPYAFAGCTALTDVSFGSTDDATVSVKAFADCTALKTITFPDDSEVSSGAVEGCYNLEEIINAPGELYLYSDYSDSFEDNCPKNKDDEFIFKLKKIIFQEGYEDITGIEQSDLWYQAVTTPYLSDITLPSTVEYVSGFEGTPIKSIDLPNGLIEIGSYAFAYTDLGKITIPESVRIIGDGAFQGCTKLTGPTRLPSAIEEVGGEAFEGCVNLHMAVVHPGTVDFFACPYKNSGITSIKAKFADDMIYFDYSSFNGCRNLKSIDISGGGYYSSDGILYYKDSKHDCLAKYPPGKNRGGTYSVPDRIDTLFMHSFDSCDLTDIYMTYKSTEDMQFIWDRFTDENFGEDLIKGPFDCMDCQTTIHCKDGSSVKSTSFAFGLGYGIVNGKKVAHKWVDSVFKLVKVGTTTTVNGNKFKVTSNKSNTVAFTKAENTKKVTVPATVKIKGTKFKVTTVNANAFKGSNIRIVTLGKNVKKLKKNAFKGSKATKIIVKSKLLKKATVKGSLKGSKVKTVQVKVGSKKDNKKFVKTYKKIFTKKNAGKKVTVK